MANVWSYEGMRVVVAGGGGAGMGAAVVTELASLGAEIHVLDIKQPPTSVASYQNVDLLQPDATAKAIDAIGGSIDAIEKWMPLVLTESFAEAKEWCEANPEAIASGYAPSKEAICVWTMWAGRPFADRGIRINTICPGPTDTPMMPAFEDAANAEIINLFARGLGRRSTPEEQAYPMIFLNSRAASYITGENLNTDGGTINALATGQLTLDFDPTSLQR
jgi:NAD(P)-dependent dehydrogenase (short-subunit alcohol dehydrogenase family)